MCTIHSLPTEIIDLIVKYLDKQTATKCSSISRHFLSSCRATTFRSVVLTWTHFHTYKTKSRQLHDILRGAPEVAQYIWSVSLHPIRESRFLPPVDPDLPWVLTQLSCVRELKLLAASHNHLSWGDLSGAFREAIVQVIRLPTLTRLSLCWLHSVPVSLFEYTNALEHLTLDGTSFSYWSATPSKNRPNLRFLKVTYATYPWAPHEYMFYQLDLGNHFLFNNLRECHMEIGKFNENALHSIFEHCIETLETLEIRLVDRISLRMKWFRSLQNLSIQLPSLSRGLVSARDLPSPSLQSDQDAELLVLIETLQSFDPLQSGLRHFTFSLLDDLPEHDELSPKWGQLDQVGREGLLDSAFGRM
ncbi:hypothetical protein BDN72DRAFT_863213 [Pluteus cervinus]|uniref:Uncharacterized protein n=1 Tax=Pluteus cervinus TaxID=181527 RepID=A0ACD3A894_9AGAR|nr:hypothetical protein BDN72DRAFT_863213 [Pluteus cervinus]